MTAAAGAWERSQRGWQVEDIHQRRGRAPSDQMSLLCCLNCPPHDTGGTTTTPFSWGAGPAPPLPCPLPVGRPARPAASSRCALQGRGEAASRTERNRASQNKGPQGSCGDGLQARQRPRLLPPGSGWESSWVLGWNWRAAQWSPVLGRDGGLGQEKALPIRGEGRGHTGGGGSPWEGGLGRGSRKGWLADRGAGVGNGV